jgi:transcription elongation factor GreA
VAGDNDDRLAALDDAVVDEAKIAQLERLIADATVIDGSRSEDGTVGLGSIVAVEDAAGRRAEYEIVGRRDERASRMQVTPGSPAGQALLGARTGDTAHVLLPNGRVRSLTVLAISPPRDGVTTADRVRRATSERRAGAAEPRMASSAPPPGR